MDTTTRQAKRAPVTLKIKFKSATLDQFIERYAVDVSPGGIFIRTKEPLGVGTQMRFEFQLRDATPLITGEGTVVWTRENDPSRPAAAPGMGVRFDRLGDGSQAILDKILAEKAKQPAAAPGGGGEGAPRGFLEVPTKVAPSPLVGALASESKAGGPGKLGSLAPSRGGFADERTDNTPLPRPMPFHSDAEEFPEEAFEEATKVRALDELVAATAAPENMPVKPRATPSSPMSAAKAEPAAAPSVTAPAVPRTSPPSAPPPSRTATPSAGSPRAERTSSPPIAASPLSDAAALGARPAPSPTPPAAPAAPAVSAFSPFDEDSDDSREVAPAAVVDKSSGAARVPAPVTPPADELAARRAREAREEQARLVPAAERSKPNPAPAAVASKPAASAVAPVPEPSSKGAAAVVVGLLLAGLVAAGVWFFVLRKTQTENDVAQIPTPATNQPGTGPATAPVVLDAAEAMVATVDAAAAVPAVETVDTEIKASVAGATVEVEGGASGEAPFKAALEKDRTYKVTVRADGHKAVTLDVKAGDSVPTVKLVPLPRVLAVTSTPPGAVITIDGANTGKKTPAKISLNKTQAAASSIKLGLRRGGFAPFNKVVAREDFAADDAGDSMILALDATLTAVRSRGGGDGPGTSGTGGDGPGTSGTGGGGDGPGTSATPTAVDAGVPPPPPVDAPPAPKPVDAPPAAPKPVDAPPPAPKPIDAPKPTPTPGTGAAPGTGTGEPTPDWMKP